MKYALSVSTGLFVFCLMQVFLELRGNKEQRMIRKRLSVIKRIRLHKTEKEEEKAEYRLNLDWMKLPGWLERDLKTAGISVESKEFAATWLLTTFFFPLLAVMLGQDSLVCISAAVFGAMAPPVMVIISKKKRLEKFQNQLGESLLILSNTIRAGLTFERALQKTAEGLPSPIHEELMQTGREIEVGASIETALSSLAERMQNDDLKLVSSAVIIQKRVGGNLADILDNISFTVKDRITIKRNVKTMTAQGKASAMVLGMLPIGLMLILSFISPGYMNPMFQTSIGKTMLMVAAVMEITGFFIMMKMTDIKY